MAGRRAGTGFDQPKHSSRRDEDQADGEDVAAERGTLRHEWKDGQGVEGGEFGKPPMLAFASRAYEKRKPCLDRIG